MDHMQFVLQCSYNPQANYNIIGNTIGIQLQLLSKNATYSIAINCTNIELIHCHEILLKVQSVKWKYIKGKAKCYIVYKSYSHFFDNINKEISFLTCLSCKSLI